MLRQMWESRLHLTLHVDGASDTKCCICKLVIVYRSFSIKYENIINVCISGEARTHNDKAGYAEAAGKDAQFARVLRIFYIHVRNSI